jgi:hypothetical protein
MLATSIIEPGVAVDPVELDVPVVAELMIDEPKEDVAMF